MNEKEPGQKKTKNLLAHIKAIGWIWITLGGTACLVVLYMILMAMPAIARQQNVSNIVDVVNFTGALILLSFLVFGLASIIAGVNFLRCREWAREVLILLTCLGGLFFLGYSALALLEFFQSTGGGSKLGLGSEGLLTNALFYLVFLVPFYLMGRFLNSNGVRKKMSS